MTPGKNGLVTQSLTLRVLRPLFQITSSRFASLWDMLVSRVCLMEQRKQSFLTLAKENQSPLGLYRNPPTFFFTNPRFVLLINDQRFVLFRSLSTFVTNHATPTSYVIRRIGLHIWQSSEVWKKCLLRLKCGYFSYKNAWIRYRRPLFTPGAVWGRFYYGCAHLMGSRGLMDSESDL